MSTTSCEPRLNRPTRGLPGLPRTASLARHRHPCKGPATCSRTKPGARQGSTSSPLPCRYPQTLCSKHPSTHQTHNSKRSSSSPQLTSRKSANPLFLKNSAASTNWAGCLRPSCRLQPEHSPKCGQPSSLFKLCEAAAAPTDLLPPAGPGLRCWVCDVLDEGCDDPLPGRCCD